MSAFEVVVYTSTGCPYCEKVKKQLTEWGIEYEVRNVSIHKAYFDELRERKVFGTPATYINGKLILGFQEKKFKKFLELEDSNEELEKAEPSVEDEIFDQLDKEILTKLYDLVIIGGGAAGTSAAIYSARSKLRTLVIDKAPMTGALALNQKIANYPGIRENVTGLQLLTRMQAQAKDFGAKFVRSSVHSVNFVNENKEINISEGVIKAKAVFIAVGAKAPSGKIKGEAVLAGRGVSYCPTCDAGFFQDKLVVVVGDSEESIQETVILSRFCKEIRFLIPTDGLLTESSIQLLQAQCNVTIFKKHCLKEIKGTGHVEAVVVATPDEKEVEWNVDGVFLNLAEMKPGTDFLGNAVARDQEGYIVVDEQMQTSVTGVYAGGDARKTIVKQAVVSAADGAIAALGIDQYVNKRSKLKAQY